RPGPCTPTHSKFHAPVCMTLSGPRPVRKTSSVIQSIISMNRSKQEDPIICSVCAVHRSHLPPDSHQCYCLMPPRCSRRGPGLTFRWFYPREAHTSHDCTGWVVRCRTSVVGFAFRPLLAQVGARQSRTALFNIGARERMVSCFLESYIKRS
ncbi:uncharacterized protein EI90DRAFT_3052176, partial [Cantharellus anzutake]|uniref:uncharacterized protein n=1 Tax=Cantharellus anzutake TaxID=1750568 RepID=UPI0019065701